MAGFVAFAIFAIIFIASRRLWIAVLLSVVVAGAIGSNAPPHPVTVAAQSPRLHGPLP